MRGLDVDAGPDGVARRAWCPGRSSARPRVVATVRVAGRLALGPGDGRRVVQVDDGQAGAGRVVGDRCRVPPRARPTAGEIMHGRGWWWRRPRRGRAGGRRTGRESSCSAGRRTRCGGRRGSCRTAPCPARRGRTGDTGLRRGVGRCVRVAGACWWFSCPFGDVDGPGRPRLLRRECRRPSRAGSVVAVAVLGVLLAVGAAGAVASADVAAGAGAQAAGLAAGEVLGVGVVVLQAEVAGGGVGAAEGGDELVGGGPRGRPARRGCRSGPRRGCRGRCGGVRHRRGRTAAPRPVRVPGAFLRPSG